MGVIMANYAMIQSLSVAVCQIMHGGEMVNNVFYNGKSHAVLIKDMKFSKKIQDKVFVDASINGRIQRQGFDFSKVRIRSLIEEKLFLATIHPSVTKIEFTGTDQYTAEEAQTTEETD